MSPFTFRGLREQMGLTQVELAAILHAGERTVRHWEAGEREIPALVARIMLLMLSGRVTAQDLRPDDTRTPSELLHP